MSEILIGSNPDDVNAVTTLPQTDEEKAKQLPEPVGYRILCALPDTEKTYESGIIKADTTLHFEEVLSSYPRSFLSSKWDQIVIKTQLVSLPAHGAR